MQSNVPRVKLREVLTLSKVPVTIDPLSIYKQVTVRLFHKGLVLREEKTGQEIQSNQWLVKKDQFVISRIDARNGAMGIVPPELDGSVVTNDFLRYDINTDRLNVKFFDFLTSTENFVRRCAQVSEGTTNRKRLRPDLFLNLEILLPPLKDQRFVVGKLERLMARIEEARQQQMEAVINVESIINSAIGKTIFSNSYPHILFEKVLANAKNGIYKSPIFLGNGLPCIRMFNIQNGTITFSDIVLIDVTEAEIQNYHCRTGDIIFNRVNSRELVGKTGLVPENSPKCVFESKNIRLRVKEDLILPKFAVYVINSPQSRKYFLNVLKQQCGQATLNRGHLNRLSIPLPPLPEQRLIIFHLERLQVKVDEVKRLQTETEREMVALVPAVLAKAFGG